MADLRQTLREVIAEIGEIDEVESISDTADLYTDLGLDSMQALEIVLEIERRLGVSISEEALRRIRTLADAVSVVEGQGGEREG